MKIVFLTRLNSVGKMFIYDFTLSVCMLVCVIVLVSVLRLPQNSLYIIEISYSMFPTENSENIYLKNVIMAYFVLQWIVCSETRKTCLYRTKYFEIIIRNSDVKE